MQQLPERRQTTKDIDPTKQAAKEQVRQAVRELVSQTQSKTLEWFTEQLRQRQISVRYTRDAQGILRGVSFEYEGVGLTGQQVGYKAAQLRADTATGQQPAQQLIPALPRPLRPEKPQPKKRGPKR